MVHQYKLNGYNIVLDTCSGSIHVVDEVAYDLIAMYKEKTENEIISILMEKYKDRDDVTEEDLKLCMEDVAALEKAHPKDLDASEIEVRLGATWVDPEYITEFMGETFKTPWYLLGKDIDVRYAEVNGQWNISGKNRDSYGNPLVTSTYGTPRVNA